MRAPRPLATLVAAACGLLVGGAGGAGAVTVPPEFDQHVLADGVAQPSQVAWAPDGRMFIATKPGVIRTVTAAGTLLATPLLDISARVNQLQDRGLLGLAVDRDFATNRRLYYAYTYDLAPATPDSDAPMVARVEWVTVGAENTAGPPTIELRPQTVSLTLRSDPPGVPLGYSDQTVTAPQTRDAAVGFRTTLTAPASFSAGGRSHRFLSWSDGGAIP